MATIIKQTLSNFDDKKHSILAKADKNKEGEISKSAIVSSIYLLRKGMEKAGVKPSRVSSVDIQVTLHEKK